MRRLSLFALFFLFSVTVFGLELGTENKQYFLGDSVRVFGECSGSTAGIELSAAGREIFSDVFECIDNGFSADILTDFSFPEGKWQVRLVSGQKTAEKSIFVLPVKEARLLSVRILSPASGARTKASSFVVSAELSYLGKKIDDAGVFLWGTDGKKVGLEPMGNGVFEGTVFMPAGFQGNSFELVVSALSTQNGNPVGGLQRLVLPVSSANILVSVVKPRSWIFSSNLNEEIVVKASYSNGEALKNASVRAIVGGKEIAFVQSEVDTFRGSVYFSASETGSHAIKLSVSDGFGNTVEEHFDSFVEKSILPSQGELVFFGIVGLAVALALLAVFYFFFSYRSVKDLASDKKTIEMELKSLENDYFREKRISREFFESERKRLSDRLSRVRGKLKQG